MSEVTLKPTTVLQAGSRIDTVENFVKSGVPLSALQGLVDTGAMSVIGEAKAVPGASVGQAAEALAQQTAPTTQPTHQGTGRPCT